jgi:hypothetical protein
MEIVIIVLNIGRALMVCWALYSLVLIFFPAAVQRPSDPIGGPFNLSSRTQSDSAWTVHWVSSNGDAPLQTGDGVKLRGHHG